MCVCVSWVSSPTYTLLLSGVTVEHALRWTVWDPPYKLQKSVGVWILCRFVKKEKKLSEVGEPYSPQSNNRLRTSPK